MSDETITLTRDELAAIVETAVSEALTTVAADLETLAQIRAAQREYASSRRKSDPEYVAREKAYKRTDEAIKRAREKRKARLANDPVFRAQERARDRARYHRRKAASLA